MIKLAVSLVLGFLMSAWLSPKLAPLIHIDVDPDVEVVMLFFVFGVLLSGAMLMGIVEGRNVVLVNEKLEKDR